MASKWYCLSTELPDWEVVGCEKIELLEPVRKECASAHSLDTPKMQTAYKHTACSKYIIISATPINPTLKHVIIQTKLWMGGIEDENNNTGAEIEGIAKVD